MKKFQFRLDTVMKVHQLHQNDAETTLQKRMSADNLAHQQLTEYQQTLQNNSDLINNKHQEVKSVADLLQHRLFFNILNSQVDYQKKLCSETRKEVQQAREVLVEASKRTQTIENLKGKQYRQHYQQMLKEEQNELDEIAQRKKSRL
jgi:flagellar export protein FliJ